MLIVSRPRAIFVRESDERTDGRGLAGWLATLPLTFNVREPRPGVRCSCKPVCGNSHTYIESDPDGRPGGNFNERKPGRTPCTQDHWQVA